MKMSQSLFFFLSVCVRKLLGGEKYLIGTFGQLLLEIYLAKLSSLPKENSFDYLNLIV